MSDETNRLIRPSIKELNTATNAPKPPISPLSHFLLNISHSSFRLLIEFGLLAVLFNHQSFIFGAMIVNIKDQALVTPIFC